MKYKPADEQALMTEIWDPEIADDLEKFVLFVYPWGKEGTPLERFKGPRTWQRDELQAKTDHIKRNRQRMDLGQDPVMWRGAKASGRGIGKSADVSWESHWMASTRLGSTTIITANTETQLKTRTFAEITKWNTLAINGHWFETTVLSVRPAPWFEQALKKDLQIDTGYYYIQGQLWSEENPDAFAGVHNPSGVMLKFDEASGIPQTIFDVAEGFFTEPELNRYWDIYSNPRRNSGGFYNCFHDHRKFWTPRQIDSRTVEGTDKALFERMIAQYGIDSDVVRVEVLGKFPSQGENQFIGSDLVEQARTRDLVTDPGAPLIMGVDPARGGKDKFKIRWRQGPDARSIPPVELTGRDKQDTYASADAVAMWIDKTDPDAVNIDAGNGTGLIDILRRKGYKVNEVWFGSNTGIPEEWANTRTWMYAQGREWLRGGCIDMSEDLQRDLTAPEAHPHGKSGDKTILQSKEELRAQGLPSPDDGDAFILTFHGKHARRDRKASRSARSKDRRVRGVDYPLFG